tara:strand:+ start:84 stop:350 length:267 start_codon:yes stop_codon:yes gene_type:complete
MKKTVLILAITTPLLFGALYFNSPNENTSQEIASKEQVTKASSCEKKSLSCEDKKKVSCDQKKKSSCEYSANYTPPKPDCCGNKEKPL